jgi:hypothetical protein
MLSYQLFSCSNYPPVIPLLLLWVINADGDPMSHPSLACQLQIIYFLKFSYLSLKYLHILPIKPPVAPL